MAIESITNTVRQTSNHDKVNHHSIYHYTMEPLKRINDLHLRALNVHNSLLCYHKGTNGYFIKASSTTHAHTYWNKESYSPFYFKHHE